MGIKPQILNSLVSGRWLFDLIAPAFRIELTRKLISSNLMTASASEDPFWKLTLLRYKNERINSVAISQSVSVKTESHVQMLRLIRASDNQNALASILGTRNGLADFSPDYCELLAKAIELAQGTWPEVKSFLSHSTFFARATNVTWRSASSPHIFGVLALSDKTDSMSPDTLSISLIHELAHQELFLINLADRLINSDADYSLAHSPFQGKARPPIGRLHSLYALFRMIGYTEKLKIVNERHRRLFAETVRSFSQGELTEFGGELVATCAKVLSIS